MSVFLLKLALSYSSKEYDQVTHSLLFEKLRNRETPICFIRLLKNGIQL